MMKAYDVGDVLRVTATFVDIDGAPTDPNVVYFSFRTPQGVKTTYQYQEDIEIVRVSQGKYYCDLSFTEAGRWTVRFHSTGMGQTSIERQYYIRASSFESGPVVALK